MENILVSACLLGVHCRYDGKCQQIEAFDAMLPQLLKRFHVIPVCPEVYGGLSTPRPPAEICRESGRVITKDKNDVTAAFERGARETLRLAALYGCRYAVLKMRSPSCGSSQIYDGAFQKNLVSGDGITAKLLKENGIYVFGETELQKLFVLSGA